MEYTREVAEIYAQIKRFANVSDVSFFSSQNNYSDISPVVACVGLEELAEICEAKGSKAYLITWKDMLRLCVKGNVKLLIGAIMAGVDESLVEPVTFPPKYADFADVFGKHQADVLAEHSQHNLAIEIEKDKVLLFGPTYDYSMPKLKVLREYINKMLAKGFIVPSKSLLGAPVLFTKKSNGGLQLCVDFCGLNAITKKNKHPLPLICTLLNLFAGAK